MKTLGITQAVCRTCRRIVPAKVAVREGDVWFIKHCPDHGEQQSLVRRGVEDYLRAQHFVKPAWVPRQFGGDARLPCPEGCGFCSRHEQHLCMPIVEITSRCDLSCPVCLVDAGDANDMSVDTFRRVLDGLIAAEGQVDVLNLSGGEPLTHPRVREIVAEALSRPEIVRVSISTNGLRLLGEPDLLDWLKAGNVVISLQFDGFSDDVYSVLRGRPLLKDKRAILELLAASAISTSLTFTLAGGVNEDQLPATLEYLFEHPHVVSMMIQPMSFAGRGRSLADQVARLSIPDVLRLLDSAGNPRVRAADFAPLPCSHPLCFNLAYYLVLDDGGSVSVNQLVGAGQMMDSLANRTIFGLDPDEAGHLKDLVYELWSGPAALAPDADGVMSALRGIIDELTGNCGCFDPRRAFGIAERRVKSIFIHAFQDAETFDLARARRCCNAYPQPDGRLMPACVFNVLTRGRNDERAE